MAKNKPYIVFIEGQDRVGKTSIIKPLFEARGKIDNILDRGPLSNYVYSKIYNRNVILDYYHFNFALSEYIIIYLDLDIEEIKRRTIESNDFGVPLEDIPFHKQEFDKAYEIFKHWHKDNIYKIDCNNKTIQEIVNEIKEILDNRDACLNIELTERLFNVKNDS